MPDQVRHDKFGIAVIIQSSQAPKMMMFILKKMISRFFFPLSLVIELLLLGIFLKKRRTKVILAGVAILYLFSFSPFGYLILRPLESQYVPI